MDGRILTCVYCGHEYLQDTPARGTDILTEHIKRRPKHPMRKADADIALLRSALIGFVGADGADALREMEVTLSVLPMTAADKSVSIAAIRALLETLPADDKGTKEGVPHE